VNTATTLRLAVAGSRSDTVRIALTAVGASVGTVALLASATVLSIVTPHWDINSDGKVMVETGSGAVTASEDIITPYTNGLLNEPGLRPGLAVALVLMTIPIFTFVAQCGRLGAPARERRLAAIRMAGATPQQITWIAAVETGVGALLGSLVGLGCFLAGRALLDNPNAKGQRPIPTDVLPSWPWLVAVVAVVPLVVTLIAVVALRRAAVTPLGVVRMTNNKRPNVVPGLLIGLGVGAFAVIEPLTRYFERENTPGQTVAYVLIGLMFIGMLLVSIGIVTGTAWLTYASGRVLHRFARRPAALLAGRRMIADPWSGSRTFAAMLVALVIGGFAAGIYASTLASAEASERQARLAADLFDEPYLGDSSSEFHLRAYELVGYAVLVAVIIAAAGLLVALVDGIVSRRRALTSLIAGGTPRGVLARATLWQVLTPVAPAILLASSVGVVLTRRILREAESGSSGGYKCTPLPGDPANACDDFAYVQANGTYLEAPAVKVPIPVPWEQLGLLAGSAMASAVVITLIGLLFLRMSTNASELRTS
jgi:hypothetical protein